MVVEKLIKVEPARVIRTPCATYRICEGKARYTLLPESEPFKVMYEYWYDGVVFYIGSKYANYPEIMIDGVCFMSAVSPLEGKRQKPQVLIQQFKSNLQKSELTIHEVVRNARLRNSYLEAWISSLII